MLYKLKIEYYFHPCSAFKYNYNIPGMTHAIMNRIQELEEHIEECNRLIANYTLSITRIEEDKRRWQNEFRVCNPNAYINNLMRKLDITIQLITENLNLAIAYKEQSVNSLNLLKLDLLGKTKNKTLDKIVSCKDLKSELSKYL